MPRSRTGTPVTDSPKSRTSPESGVSSPASTRSSVDLPPPDGPSRAVSEPSGTCSETSSRALKPLQDLLTLRTSMDICFSRLLAAVQQGHGADHGECEQREHDRRRVCAGEIEGLKALLDEERHRLRPALDLARHDRDGAELAERARRREDHAVGDAPAD